MKKLYLTPETLVIDVENDCNILDGSVKMLSDEEDISSALGQEDRGSSIWDNEW